MVWIWSSWAEWDGKLMDVMVSVTVCLFEYEPILFFFSFFPSTFAYRLLPLPQWLGRMLCKLLKYANSCKSLWTTIRMRIEGLLLSVRKSAAGRSYKLRGTCTCKDTVEVVFGNSCIMRFDLQCFSWLWTGVGVSVL